MTTDEQQIRDSVRAYAAGSGPPADLLNRALEQASRRRRVRMGIGVASTALALVAGTFAGATALARSDRSGSPPTDEPTTAAPSEEQIAQLTGKNLADALGLTAVVGCGIGLQVAKDPLVTLCLPANTGWSPVEEQEIMLQLRGYERTDAMRAFAEQQAKMQQFGRDPDRDATDWPDLANESERLKAQLEAEQGAHPENGFEAYESSDGPTAD
jgi:hypothetical protein